MPGGALAPAERPYEGFTIVFLDSAGEPTSTEIPTDRVELFNKYISGKMSLAHHIDHLLTQYAPATRFDDVRVVEVGAGDYDGSGFPIVRRASLAEPAAYSARFLQLLVSGYSWLNVSFYGILDEHPLIAVEVPRTGGTSASTSVNYSGPSKAVVDAGGDARAGIALR